MRTLRRSQPAGKNRSAEALEIVEGPSSMLSERPIFFLNNTNFTALKPGNAHSPIFDMPCGSSICSSEPRPQRCSPLSSPGGCLLRTAQTSGFRSDTVCTPQPSRRMRESQFVRARRGPKKASTGWISAYRRAQRYKSQCPAQLKRAHPICPAREAISIRPVPAAEKGARPDKPL